MLASDRAVNCHGFTADRASVPFVSVATAGKRKVSPLGERIRLALDAAARTQNSTEVALVEKGVLSKGQLSSLISGRRGTKSINVDVLGGIADYLGVEFDWLARGHGPMRKGGRGATPFEDAATFVRRYGFREDAIDAAAARYKDHGAEMSAAAWVIAFDQEARLLTGVPTPVERRTQQAKIARQKKKLERVRERAAAPTEEKTDETSRMATARRKRASGGL